MTNVCMYLRLSREDGEDRESNSIANQRELINSYAKNNGMTIEREFVDDGISGATFDRPEFKKMIQAIEDKEIDTVIVKDLSRFGRDYIQAGRYLQQIFPELNVRFISVNDNYDSENADVSNTHLILPIKNFINDSYCRDISMKVRSAQKVKRNKGEYIGAFAPFGYLKDPKDKHQLIIDLKVKPIIEEIFRLKIMGYSSKSIAELLNKRGIPTPLKHKKDNNSKYATGFATKNNKWDCKTINRIIRNKVYIGYLEQGKHTKLNYKSDLTINVNEEDWVVVKNAHQPIVSKTVYNIANKILLRDTKNHKDDPSIFAGMLYCKDCKSPMIKRKYKVKNGISYNYICSCYNKGGACTRHTIKAIDLKETLDNVIKERLTLHDELLEKISSIDITNIKLNIDVEELQKDKHKYEMMARSIYMDLEDGLIDEQEFELFRKNYLDKAKEIEQEIQNKQRYAIDLQKQIESHHDWLSDLKNKQAISECNRELLVFLIDKIEIGEEKSLSIQFNDVNQVEFLRNVIEHSNALGGENNGSNKK